jgi:hypothetical protein
LPLISYFTSFCLPSATRFAKRLQCMPRRQLDPLAPSSTASAPQQPPQPALPPASVLASQPLQPEPNQSNEQPTPQKLLKSSLTVTNKHLHLASPQTRPRFRPPLLKAFSFGRGARSARPEAEGVSSIPSNPIEQAAVETRSLRFERAPQEASSARVGEEARPPRVGSGQVPAQKGVEQDLRSYRKEFAKEGDSPTVVKTR